MGAFLSHVRRSTWRYDVVILSIAGALNLVLVATELGLSLVDSWTNYARFFGYPLFGVLVLILVLASGRWLLSPTGRQDNVEGLTWSRSQARLLYVIGALGVLVAFFGILYGRFGGLGEILNFRLVHVGDAYWGIDAGGVRHFVTSSQFADSIRQSAAVPLEAALFVGGFFQSYLAFDLAYPGRPGQLFWFPISAFRGKAPGTPRNREAYSEDA